jgi:hypothetical protein
MNNLMHIYLCAPLLSHCIFIYLSSREGLLIGLREMLDLGRLEVEVGRSIIIVERT